MSTLIPLTSPADPSPPLTPGPTPRQRAARALVLARRATSYWRAAAAVLVVGLAATVVASARAQQTYRSECVVLYKAAQTADAEGGGAQAQKIAPRLREILLTRARLEAIVRAEDLYPDLARSPGRGMGDAIDELRAHVDLRGRDSETFVVSFEAASGAVSQRITARLSSALVDDFRGGQVSSSEQQLDFVRAEEKRVEAELEAASKDRAKFLADHPEFAPEASGMARGAVVDPELAALLLWKAKLEDGMRRTRAPAPAGASPASRSTASTTNVASLTHARDEAVRVAAQARDDLAQKRATYTERHPDVIAAARAVEETARGAEAAKAALAAAQDGAPSDGARGPASGSTLRQSPAARRELAAVKLAIAQREARVGAGALGGGAAWVALQTDWQTIARRLADLHSTLQDLHRRGEGAHLRASAARGSGADQLEVLDPPILPRTPTRDGKLLAALGGGSFALLMAAFVAVGRARFNDVLLDAGDVAALNAGPVLAVLPFVDAPAPAPADRELEAAERARDARGASHHGS